MSDDFVQVLAPELTSTKYTVALFAPPVPRSPPMTALFALPLIGIQESQLCTVVLAFVAVGPAAQLCVPSAVLREMIRPAFDEV